MHIYRSVGSDQKLSTDGSTDDENHNDINIKDNYDCDNQADYSGCDNLESALTETKSVPPGGSKVACLELEDLSWVGTLGIGGFGRVELVTAGLNNNLAFALKKLKKIEVSSTFTSFRVLVSEQKRFHQGGGGGGGRKFASVICTVTL